MKVAEVVKQFKIISFEHIHNFIKNYNSLMVLCLLLTIVGLYLCNKSRKKKGISFIQLKIINVISHIALACIFGYLIKITNVTKISQLLTMYWSIGLYIYVFFFIVFIKELSIYLKSSKKITGNFSNIYYFLGLTYIFTAIGSNKLVIVNDLLMILLFLVGWLVLQIMSLETKTEDEDLVDEESDVEIKSFTQLLPTREQEYNRILSVLKENNYDEPFALVLNGDWGIGKTSLINVLSKKIVEDGNFKIFIQPMILDTTEKQMEYFFGQLEDILSINGIYTGKNSPFKKYINIIFQTINTLNLKQVIKLDGLLDSMNNDEQLDFRNSKEKLEKDIQKLLISMEKKNKNINDSEHLSSSEENDLDITGNKKKIYIIVDDFDRVEEETFKNTLIFIKELVNFKGINVIFLMDEQKIDAHEKVNRTYLDKFVNKRFQLSKIDYQEIFSHFIKNLRKEHLANDWVKEIGNIIERNIVIYIKALTKDFENKIDEIQDNINNLSANKTNKGHPEKNEIITEQYKKLTSEKDELEKHLQKLNDGLTNVRRTKKIIREIKEILVACDRRDLENENFKVNLSKIDGLEELIVRIAIFKMLFGEQVDKLIEKNDFFSVMSNIKYLKYKEYLLSAFFLRFINSSITEEQGLKMDIINDFCNALILSHSFNRLFVDKKTASKNILNKLDDQTNSLCVKSMEEIKEYLRAIMFDTYSVDSNKTKARKIKLINHIIALHKEGELTLKNLFEILGEPQRNPLLDNKLYLSKLKQIIGEDAFFQKTNDKTACFSYLEGITMPIFLSYKYDIVIMMSLLKLNDPLHSYERFSAELSSIHRLDGITRAIKRIFTIENDSISELEFFKQWFNSAIKTITSDHQDNRYILESVKHYEHRISEFIEIYQLKEEITVKLQNTSVEPTNKFHEELSINSAEELISYINGFHEYICDNKNTMTSQHLINFNKLLVLLERHIRSLGVKNELMDKVEDLYDSIPLDEYDDESDQKRAWLWCTLTIGTIKERLKQLELQSDEKEKGEL